MKHTLIVGTVFDTLYERGCKITTLPDANGNFLAFDSDGVECQFHVSMVMFFPNPDTIVERV